MKPIAIPAGVYKGEPVTFGENQADRYNPLPGIIVDHETGCIVTRWELDPEELEMILSGARVAVDLRILTFGNRMSPVMLDLVEQ